MLLFDTLSVLVLSQIRRTRSVVTIVRVEVVLASQILNNVVAIIERRSATTVVGQQRIVVAEMAAVGNPWTVAYVVEVR